MPDYGPCTRAFAGTGGPPRSCPLQAVGEHGLCAAHHSTMADVHAERDAARREVERLKAALVMYGAHTGGCGYEGGPKADPRTGYRCRCGLYDIIDGEAHLAALDQ